MFIFKPTFHVSMIKFNRKQEWEKKNMTWALDIYVINIMYQSHVPSVLLQILHFGRTPGTTKTMK